MSEAVSIPESMFNETYKATSWGVVRGYSGFLVGYRNKGTDPLRKNNIVFPGGGVKATENFEEAGAREVCEETGVKVCGGKLLRSDLTETNLINYGEMTALVEPEGTLWVRYADSKKYYTGEVYEFQYREEMGEPVGGDDLASPGFMPFASILRNREQFTPACRVIVNILENIAERRDKLRDAKIVSHGLPLDKYLNAKIQKE